MALTNVFKEAVAEGNVRKIRIMLKDSLLVDPTFARFNEMEKVASSVEGLYDEHDGRNFIANSEEWDDAYMDKIMVQVVGNFSHERISHLKDVVRKLRPVPKASNPSTRRTEQNTGTRNERTPIPYQEQKKRDQKSGNYKYAAGMGTGAAIGGIAGCVGGTIASLSLGGIIGCTIGGAVIGAAAGGAVVYLASGKE